MIRLLALAALVLAGGCSNARDSAFPGPSQLVTAVDTAVLISSDKPLIDHAATLVTGEDCSTIAYQNDGHYCRPWPEGVTVTKEPVYCYRTLGEVECHTTPNPYGGNPQPVSQRFVREVARPHSEAPEAAAARTNFN